MNNTQTRLSLFTLLLLGLIGVSSISCSTDNGIEPILDDPFVAPSAREFSNLREIALARHTETALFNAEDGISFTSDDNAILDIPANCLRLNGDLVSGEVELTYVDIYESKYMAPTNKPTMGLKPNGDKAMIITGGEFFIEVRKDGVLLDSSCRFKLIVPGENTGGVDNEMILWTGIIDDDGDLTWDPMEENREAEIYFEDEDYFVFTHDFGWTNIDKFFSDPREKTTMRVKAPEGFNYSNSAVYLSYDGEPHALAQLDTFDEETEIFSEHYGQIPIGLDVHIIFVSADGDDWRYAIQGVSIAENEIYEFTLEETETGTYENWVSAIEDLP